MINENMMKIARKLVEIPSINTTLGEYEIGVFLEKYLRNIPYFQNHPEQVIVQELKDDELHRRSVFAILIGEKNPKKDTLLFHGHTDTVGLEGFGALEPYAFDPEKLAEKMKTVELPKEVYEDLVSGQYMFGRGACDMKSGDAVFIGLIEELSKHPEELSGNIVLSLNPVEENLHTGIIEGLDTLLELKEKYDLEYTLAINNDFICPLYPEDEKITIYTGTVGKLLPCFYIQGKETHVGQCFEGFDASLIAAKLADKITLQNEFADGYEGEYTYPPSVLKIKDLKPWYNVQTAAEAFIYFNYFVHNASMDEIVDKLKNASRQVFEELLEKMNREYQRFCNLSEQKYEEITYDSLIVTYDELLQIAKQKKEYCQNRLDDLIEQQIKDGVDKREIPIEIIKYLLQVSGITSPAIVLYFAAPYCPHNTLQGEDSHFIDDIKEIAKEIEKEHGVKYRYMKFFPSLSDSSYIKIDDSEKSIQLLLENFPAFHRLYPIPIQKIKALNIPAINYGCYGKDAHKWTERVHIPYTFGVLPKLLEKTVDRYLR